jgi:hypothetical protein
VNAKQPDEYSAHCPEQSPASRSCLLDRQDPGDHGRRDGRRCALDDARPLGDFVATTTGLGFELGALVFAVLIAVIAAAHYFTRLPTDILFWSAYILSRPLGATLGDTLTKPQVEGGLALGRIASSLVLLAAMIVLVLATSLRQRACEGPSVSSHAT